MLRNAPHGGGWEKESNTKTKAFCAMGRVVGDQMDQMTTNGWELDGCQNILVTKHYGRPREDSVVQRKSNNTRRDGPWEKEKKQLWIRIMEWIEI